jgi:hypothetical protein
MLKFYIKAREAAERLRTDKDGVVSFEYLIVAFCIVSVVLLVFGTTSTSTLGQALTNAIGVVANQVGGA